MKRFFAVSSILFFLALTLSTVSQTRIAVLPFENMDGKAEFNLMCYEMADSLYKTLLEADPDEDHYRIVPLDSVDMVLAEMNMDPNSPQYKTDMWKAISKLNIKKVILGNMLFQAGNFLFDTYIYDVRMKLPDPKNKSEDIFKAPDKIFEAIPEMTANILPGLKKS